MRKKTYEKRSVMVDKDLEKAAQEAIDIIESLNKILNIENPDNVKIENIRAFVEEKLKEKE